jgi:glutamyl-tRNA synthetase
VNLGWALDDKQDTFSLKELEKVFSIEGIGKSSPRFQIDKLNYFNQHYIRKMSVEDYIEKAKQFTKKHNIDYDSLSEDKKKIYKDAVKLTQERITIFPDIIDWIKFLFINKIEYRKQKDLIQKKMDKEKTLNLLNKMHTLVENLETFTNESIESEVKKLYDEMGIKSRPFFMTIRVAITGSPVSLPLYESMIMLGKERTLKNIQDSINTVKEMN